MVMEKPDAYLRSLTLRHHEKNRSHKIVADERSLAIGLALHLISR